MFCREQAAQLRAHQTEFAGAGARLVFIGQGNVDQARDFQAERAPDVSVLTDPSRATYHALGARRGTRLADAPALAAAGARALAQGHLQGRTQGDAAQHGGVLVVAPGDRLLYWYLSRHAGDHPAPATILAALRSAG